MPLHAVSRLLCFFQSALTAILLSIPGALLALPLSIAYAEDTAAHCAKVGDDDAVKTVSAALVVPARKLFGLNSEMSDALVRKSTSFRCMNRNVWLCNYGANLVCGKANASLVSAGATEFCKRHPNADGVPMAATGHDTIYDWKCVAGVASISKQIETVDARGFIAENWKPLDH